MDFFESDYDLIKLSYFQQFIISHSQIFDYKGKGFESIFKLYPKFLIDFLSEFCTDRIERQIDRKINLGFIWKYDEVEEIITNASDFLIENNYYLGLGDHAHSLLFKKIDSNCLTRAFEFLLKEIEIYNKEARRIEIYFETIRNHFGERFEEALLFFLSVNSDVETFKEIDWVGNVGVVTGDVYFGDLYAKRWENILNMVNKSNATLAMIPIKSFLKKKIRDQYRWAESERERKFSTPDW